MCTRITTLALLCCILVACKKSNHPDPTPPPTPPPVEEEIKDCIPVRVSSDDGAGGYIQTEFFYSAQKRQPDSSRNPFFFTKFYYQDTLLIKREVLYTSTTQIRNYDSFFYNTNGSLQKIKMFNVNDYSLTGVRDIVVDYTYSGNQLTKLVTTESKSGNFLHKFQFEFTYDAKENISDIKATFDNDSPVYGKYYYSDENNPFPRLKVPIGYFFHGAGLNRPYYMIGTYLPMFLSSKKMNKVDDTSGNIGSTVQITGSNSSPIVIRENNFASYIITLDCR